MRGHHPALPDLHHAGKVLLSEMEKVQVFSEYFSSVFTSEDTSYLGRLEEELHTSRSEAKIEEVVLTENEVYEELRMIEPYSDQSYGVSCPKETCQILKR